MLKKQHKIIIFSLVLMGALFYSHSAYAATVNITSSDRTGVYDVVLSLEGGEDINAVEGTIIFDENTKVVPVIEKNDSIIPLWTKTPTVSGNSVNFSGIIPGGFSVLYDQFGGNPKTEGKLFSIEFPFAEGVQYYTFTLDSTSVYKNDGIGVATQIPSKSFILPVSGNQNPLPDDANQALAKHASSLVPVIFLGALVLLVALYLFFTRIAPKHIKRAKK